MNHQLKRWQSLLSEPSGPFNGFIDLSFTSCYNEGVFQLMISNKDGEMIFNKHFHGSLDESFKEAISSVIEEMIWASENEATDR